MTFPIRRAAALLCLLGFSVFATTYQRLDLAAMAAKADVIVYANVLSSAVETRGSLPWTTYTLQARRFAKGAADVLQTSGGQFGFSILGDPNGQTRLEGAPSFKAGEQVVLLLYASKYDNPIVGFTQGAFEVVGNAVQDLNGQPAPGQPKSVDEFMSTLSALAAKK